MTTFGLSVVHRDTETLGRVISFILWGRLFTLYDLKKAIIQASGGVLTGFFALCWDMPLEELVEAIEIVSEVSRE